MKKILNFLFDFIILFGFLFECHFIGDSLTTRRLAAVIAFVYLVIHFNEVTILFGQIRKKNFRRVLGAFIFCSLLVLISKNDTSYSYNSYFEVWYFVNIFLYVIIFPVFCFFRLKSVKYLVWLLSAILIVQAVVVFMSYISTPVRVFLYEFFYDGDDRFEQQIINGTRIMGIALHSSTGSITCSAIALLLSYATLKKDLPYLSYVILFSVLILMTLFIGRTGVLVEIVLFAFTLFFHPSKSIYKIGLLIPIFALFLYSLTTIIASSDSNTTETFVKWMTGLFNEDRTDTFNAIKSDGFPSLTHEFIFGTGIMTGKTPEGVVLRSDSGYVRLYTSLGIVGGILYYWAFYNLFNIARPKRYSSRIISLFFSLIIIIAYIIEYKEPFMMKYIFPWSIVITGLFIAKDENENIFYKQQ